MRKKEPTAIWKLKKQFQQELSHLTTIDAELEVIKELSAPIQLLSCAESLNQPGNDKRTKFSRN